jgi:ABC-type uncharacterized transport system involved in gliding motility auxiliary subunit
MRGFAPLDIRPFVNRHYLQEDENMSEPSKSQGSPAAQSGPAKSVDTSPAASTNSPSQANNSQAGVLGSRYLASEEEHRQFASDYGSELVITMSNAKHGRK